MKLVLAVVVAALAAPASAFAAGPTLIVRGRAAARGARARRRGARVSTWSGCTGAAPEPSPSARGASPAAGARGATADDDRDVERSWHFGNLDWTGAANAIHFRIGGSVTRLRAYYVWSPTEPAAAPDADRGRAADHPRVSRGVPTSRSGVRRRATPTRVHFAIVHHTAGIEQLHARAVRCDRARNRDLPREGQRLERHRLQLPRRQVRADLRGPLRRHGQARDRRARIGLQHRRGRRLGDRRLPLRRDLGRGEGFARTAARLAARRCARRPPLVGLADLRREPEVPTWRPGLAARHLRASRRQLHRLPWQRAVCRAAQIARDVAALGGPKIYAPVVSHPGESQVRFTARLSVAAAVDGDDPRLERRAGRPGHRQRHDCRLDVGCVAGAGRPLPVGDRDAGRALGDRRARRNRRGRRAEGGRLADGRCSRGDDDHLVHPHRRSERRGDARRSRTGRSCRRCSPREVRRCANARIRSAAGAAERPVRGGRHRHRWSEDRDCDGSPCRGRHSHGLHVVGLARHRDGGVHARPSSAQLVFEVRRGHRSSPPRRSHRCSPVRSW